MPAGERIQTRLSLIAAGAALLGGLIGGGFSYLGVKQQISAQEEQSQSEYLRTQRKVAYSAMLNTAQLLNNDQSELLLDVDNKDVTPIPSRKYVASLTSHQKQLDTLARDYTNVEIIGSSNVIDAADELLRIHRRIYGDIIGANLGDKNPQGLKSLVEGYDHLDDAVTARSDFVAAVRKSLKVRTD